MISLFPFFFLFLFLFLVLLFFSVVQGGYWAIFYSWPVGDTLVSSDCTTRCCCNRGLWACHYAACRSGVRGRGNYSWQRVQP